MKAFYICLLLAGSPACAAQGIGTAPADPDALSWQQKPGAQVPLRTQVIDEEGHAAALGDFFRRVPVLLDIGYFQCPSLCGVVRADLFNALTQSGLVAGQDYTLVSVSIDPAETPQIAARAKQLDRVQFPLVVSPAFHYVTAKRDSVGAITAAVGFPHRYDSRFGQFMHPAGMTILTGKGEVSSYLLGVGYTPGDLRAAVLRARAGGIARAALPILLLCFHFDPNTGRYTLAIIKLLRLMGVLTVATIAVMLLVLHRTGRRAGA